jgi:hypothetical protein
VRVRELFLRDWQLEDEELAATLACVSAHAPLAHLLLAVPLWTPAALDSVVNLALARRLTALTFYQCSLGGDWGGPASFGAPEALARLLSGDALTELHIRLEHIRLEHRAAEPHTGRRESLGAPRCSGGTGGCGHSAPHAAHAEAEPQRRLPLRSA